MDATFCGQCGFNLQAETLTPATNVLETNVLETNIPEIPDIPETNIGSLEMPPIEEIPELSSESSAMSSPIQSPWDEEEESESLTFGQRGAAVDNEYGIELPPEMELSGEADRESEEIESLPSLDLDSLPDLNIPDIETSETSNIETPSLDVPELEVPEEPETETNLTPMPWDITEARTGDGDGPEPWETPVESEVEMLPEEEMSSVESFSSQPEITEPVVSSEPVASPPPPPPAPSFVSSVTSAGATQLQIQQVSLFHVQTDTSLEIAQNLDVVHIGKPNSQIPPDIDVSGFPNSEVVSRIHADIRIEGDAYFVEDVGSSNGTYINHAPLIKGNRHRLRAGDRISLGKGDLVTFIFQMS